MTDKTIPDWIRRLDFVSQEVMTKCRALHPSRLNWKPNDDVWSVAQILEHIIKVNASYYPILTTLHKGTFRLSWTARIPFLPRLFGRMILNSVKPENMRKTRTFPIWEPVVSSIDSGIVDDFLSHQAELKKQIESASALLKSCTLLSSPANSKIVYTLEDAFHIIVTHEERHLNQLKGILALQGKE